MINITTMFDINVSLYDYRPFDHLKRGRLRLLCDGEDCNSQFINAIGRIAVKRLPSYAFAKELIKIEKIKKETGYHDSIPFNHDMMRDRIKNTPIIGIDPGFAFLHERYWKDVDYLSPDRDIHEQEKRLEAYIDAKNTAEEGNDDAIMHVTTNDMKIFIDDELVKIYSEEYPFLIISLKPKEAFKCSMKAVLGVGIVDTCWDACSNYWFDQETVEGKTILCLESASRFDEFTLVSRSLEYFRVRTKMLKDEIHRMYLLEKERTNTFYITIVDEDHTMGEVIAYELQSHSDIAVASNSKHDHLVRTIELKIVAFDKDKLLDAVTESMDTLLSKIDAFEEQFNNIENPLTMMSNGSTANKSTRSSGSSKSDKSNKSDKSDKVALKSSKKATKSNKD
jgi:DNA-directed RNA polymerase subunit L